MMRVEEKKMKKRNFFAKYVYIFVSIYGIEIVFYFDTKYTYHIIVIGILNQPEQKKRRVSDDTEYEVVVISCCFGFDYYY